jgi:hypothetical protein
MFRFKSKTAYPPIGFESLNARTIEDGRFEILNTPFFSENVAYGAVVTALRHQDGDGGCCQRSGFGGVHVSTSYGDDEYARVGSVEGDSSGRDSELRAALAAGAPGDVLAASAARSATLPWLNAQAWRQRSIAENAQGENSGMIRFMKPSNRGTVNAVSPCEGLYDFALPV